MMNADSPTILGDFTSSVRLATASKRRSIAVALTILSATLALILLCAGAAAGDRPSTPNAPPSTHATIYRVQIIHGTRRLAPVELIVPGNRQAILYSLNAMAVIPDSPLPTATRAMSITVDENGVAALDFNDAFVANFQGGDEAEGLALTSILKVLAQFSGINSVQITVRGQPVDTLGGHIDLSEPLEVTPRRFEHRRRHREPRRHAPRTVAAITPDNSGRSIVPC